TPTRANYSFSPAQRSFSQLGRQTDGAFSATSTGDLLNPVDVAEYFVRQHYLDFLNREPDEAGLEYWIDRINQCESDQNCIRARRVDVSNAFFYEQEFQQTGAYVYRLYRISYGNTQPLPNPDTSDATEANYLPRYAAF